MYNLSNSSVKNTKSRLKLNSPHLSQRIHAIPCFRRAAWCTVCSNTVFTENIRYNDIVKFAPTLIRQSWKFQASHFFPLLPPPEIFISLGTSMVVANYWRARNDVNINSSIIYVLYVFFRLNAEKRDENEEFKENKIR